MAERVQNAAFNNIKLMPNGSPQNGDGPTVVLSEDNMMLGIGIANSEDQLRPKVVFEARG